MLTALTLDDVVATELRTTGSAIEVRFWRGFMLSDRCRLCWCDAIPNPELNKDVYTLVRSLAWFHETRGRTMEVLDIGSGPVSILTNAFHGLRASLKAADPLADEYDSLWTDNVRKAQVVRPVAVAGEDLVRCYGNGSFDVSHIRNAIDHACHPLAVLEQMIGITRQGGHIVIHGFENEASAEGWQGFHQWDMRVHNEELIFEGSAHQQHRVMETFGDRLKRISSYTTPLVNTKRWCTFVACVL